MDFNVGDRVILRGTSAEYTVLEFFDHYTGLKDGDRTYEQWAKLQSLEGTPAFWKVRQLGKS